MRKLPRDLVNVLLTEARNQRTPPVDYVIAEDGGRMVRKPDPDIAMAELLEEAAAALAAERAACEVAEAKLAEANKALDRIAAGNHGDRFSVAAHYEEIARRVREEAEGRA